ncbi:MAG: DNA double-strand break repair nuclease NurA [Dehalococcoidales bacterium]|nr:DNA double-strand break repair nuclease NurA [Dehalococcoidales bacterium]
MSLDLSKVANQITGMVSQLKEGSAGRQERLNNAWQTMQSADSEKLKRKIAKSKTTWLVAGLVDSLSQTYPCPRSPDDFTVLATDGSHIDVDRHRNARCFLINIGTVVLTYGTKPDAKLAGYPHLYSGETEMVIAPERTRDRDQVIEGPLLGIKRAVDECSYLAQIAAELPPGSRNLALLDGSLILWGLSGKEYPDFVIEALLEKGMLHHLDEMRKLNTDRQLAVASHISFPRSNDVANGLRVSLCPHEIVDTDRCPECKTRDCEKIAGIQDRDLFDGLLKPGERSSLFINQSSIVREHYGPHQIYFFYIKTEEEIARVELPLWVATNPELLDLTHSLILDQCNRGQGYPVALSEAHEQAVVTGADRENFWQLVESTLIEEHLPAATSVKSQSKRTRWV